MFDLKSNEERKAKGKLLQYNFKREMNKETNNILV